MDTTITLKIPISNHINKAFKQLNEIFDEYDLLFDITFGYIEGHLTLSIYNPQPDNKGGLIDTLIFRIDHTDIVTIIEKTLLWLDNEGQQYKPKGWSTLMQENIYLCPKCRNKQ